MSAAPSCTSPVQDTVAPYSCYGWPEYWKTWEPVMERLASRFELIAPDLRGFGESDKPAAPFGPNDQAHDMIALLEALEVGPVGIVAHDIGGSVAQALARRAPGRLAGLFFFDLFHPGVWKRFAAPERSDLVWHVFFHQTELAAALIGATPENIRTYITHFLRHWPYRKHAFDDVIADFVATYQAPGNVEGGLAYYRAVAAERKTAAMGNGPAPAPITLPTCVRWPERDPMFDFAWTDGLSEIFPNLDLALFPDVGHFPHREDPDRAAREIGAFFERLADGRRCTT